MMSRIFLEDHSTKDSHEDACLGPSSGEKKTK